VVADTEQSSDFYTQAPGIEIDFRYEGIYAGIMRNGYSVHLKSGNPSSEERANRLNGALCPAKKSTNPSNLLPYSYYLHRPQ